MRIALHLGHKKVCSMIDRRKFLQKAALGTVLLGTAQLPLLARSDRPHITQLTILHTNDVHSRIEPFPNDGSKYSGLGGAARRAAWIQKIRKEQEYVLLLDAGDMFQGTPYFNFFGGELEFKLMSRMGYDACTLGNHDFDGGMDNLRKQYTTHANFPIVCCNYDMANTAMEGLTRPYQIVRKGGLKIGILGVGIELDGLVPKELYKETRYQDPVEKANEAARQLKEEEKCDYIICLSHLGYKYDNNPQKISDVGLAAQSRHIDLIIGGHTHTLLPEPSLHKNLDGEDVLVNQVGWAGIALGRLDVFFEKNRKGKCVTCGNMLLEG